MPLTTRLHRDAGWTVWIPRMCGYLVTALVLPGHMAVLLYLYSDYNRHVRKKTCKNSCWDAVFKGPYESDVGSYKHLYFNATSNTFKIWLLTVTFFLTLYECIRHLTSVALKRPLRLPMLVLFSVSIYTHYYSWWIYLNYLNDEFYQQWYHQLFFSVTEMVSTILVILLADSDNDVTDLKALGIVAIAVLHVVGSRLDQFIYHVLLGKGAFHQVVRDVGLMLPDILHVVLPLIELWRVKKLNCADAGLMKKVIYMGLLVASALMLQSTLL